MQIGGSRVKCNGMLLTSVIFLGQAPRPGYSRQVTSTGCRASRVESRPVGSSQSRAAASPDEQGVTAGRARRNCSVAAPAGSAEEVAGLLLAIQAQDPRGARLAIRARSAGLSVSDVDCALAQRRSLVVTWLNRGTLHVVRTEDYWWLHPLTTPQLRTGNSRRLVRSRACRRQTRNGRWPRCGRRWPPTAR